MTAQILEAIASSVLLIIAAIIARMSGSSRRLGQQEYREEFRKTWD